MTKQENLILDLLELCDQEFKDPMIRPYAGVGLECRYCGCGEGGGHSVADCPVMKYQDILERIKNG